MSFSVSINSSPVVKLVGHVAVNIVAVSCLLIHYTVSDLKSTEEVCLRGENEGSPLRTPDQQAEIRRHLFHNIAASWFPKAAGFAQKAKADIWAAAKAFPS